MADASDIPEITNSGASGDQEPSQELVTVGQQPAFESGPMVQAVYGLAADGSRSLGSHATAQLIAGSYAQQRADYLDVRRDLDESKNELGATQTKLTAALVRTAHLEERVAALRQGHNLRSLAIAVGIALATASLTLPTEPVKYLPYIIGGLGLLIAFGGWYLGNASSDQ